MALTGGARLAARLSFRLAGLGFSAFRAPPGGGQERRRRAQRSAPQRGCLRGLVPLHEEVVAWQPGRGCAAVWRRRLTSRQTAAQPIAAPTSVPLRPFEREPLQPTASAPPGGSHAGRGARVPLWSAGAHTVECAAGFSAGPGDNWLLAGANVFCRCLLSAVPGPCAGRRSRGWPAGAPLLPASRSALRAARGAERKRLLDFLYILSFSGGDGARNYSQVRDGERHEQPLCHCR